MRSIPGLTYEQIVRSLHDDAQGAWWLELGDAVGRRAGWELALSPEGFLRWDFMAGAAWVSVEPDRGLPAFVLWQQLSANSDDVGYWSRRSRRSLLDLVRRVERSQPLPGVEPVPPAAACA